PRFWTDKQWNGAEQPVVGVSWYEAVAYCRWLSDKTGQAIMLPTEAQWQYAAQGNDGREYPWGNEWDCKRCNNSVKPCDSNVTTTVTAYEGQGDSPFGVVDMAGNVWEWCLTQYNSGSNDLNGTDVRVLRGGSWYNNNAFNFRATYRSWLNPRNWLGDRGFRVALSF
ncbi:MAG: SUMF1/EgtB/PvdO family nonheme iron enzyme, partial [Caldilineaceae bacterium]|nr:SUMF1/EgtB/PvdO family nonheme iron enzyme [Caldilineaceae bacterium]